MTISSQHRAGPLRTVTSILRPTLFLFLFLLETAPAVAAAPDLAWSTYLGGSWVEELNDIAADGTGNVWVTGLSGSFDDFPTVNGLPPSIDQDRVDAFLTGFSSDGSVHFSSLVPGPNNEIPESLIAFPGMVHLAGTTIQSSEFVLALSAWVGTDGSGFDVDSFSVEVRSSARDAVYDGSLIWVVGDWNQYDTGSGHGSFYAWLEPRTTQPVDFRLFSHETDFPAGLLASDGAGRVYVLDTTSESGQGTQLRVSRLSRTLEVLASVTLGGSGADLPGAIAVDADGNVWITGLTRSTDFPLLNPVQSQLQGTEDAFLVKLDPEGRILFSTYLGGGGQDQGQGLAAEPSGGIYVSGQTQSGNFPVTGGIPRSCAPTAASLCGPSDAFVARFGSTGMLGWAVLVGGSGEEAGIVVASPEAGAVVVAGNTRSMDFPTLNAFQPTPSDTQNGFVARLEDVNGAPDCSAATASPSTIWPPNGKLVPVSITGVTDPDGDPLTIAITGITQDEPRTGKTPDASGVGVSAAQVRASRAGGGDGRVYHITFTATDPQGASCAGTVTVCVPHDRGRGSTCGDGGALFDSTQR